MGNISLNQPLPKIAKTDILSQFPDAKICFDPLYRKEQEVAYKVLQPKVINNMNFIGKLSEIKKKLWILKIVESTNTKFMQTLLESCKEMSKLSNEHPNFTKILDYKILDDNNDIPRLEILMEYPGCALSILSNTKTNKDVLMWFVQSLSGYAYADACQIYNFDINSSMIAFNAGQIKILNQATSLCMPEVSLEVMQKDSKAMVFKWGTAFSKFIPQEGFQDLDPKNLIKTILDQCLQEDANSRPTFKKMLRLISEIEDLGYLSKLEACKAYNSYCSSYICCIKDYKSALYYGLKALDIIKMSLGKFDKEAEIAYYNMGTVYQYTGDYKNALKYFTLSLGNREKLLGACHNGTTINCLYSIGTIYSILGEGKQAFYYLNKVLKFGTFKENGLKFGQLCGKLGRLYCDLGKLSKGISLLEKALLISRENLGEDHSDTAKLYNDLGTAFHKNGDLQNALNCLQNALEISLNIYGEEHQETATCYSNIGSIYYTMKVIDEAKSNTEHGLNIRIKLFGENNSETAKSYANLALIQNSLEDRVSALHYLEKALDIQKKVYHKNHQEIAITCTNIGAIYSDSGDFIKALKYYEEALSIMQAQQDLSTAAAYNNAGSAYNALGSWKKSLEYYEKSLEINKKILGDNNIATARTYNNIGSAYFALSDPIKALQYYEYALNIQLNILEYNHPDQAISYNNIGSVYKSLKNNKLAFNYFDKALRIRQISLGDHHIDTALSYYNTGVLYHELNDKKRAINYLENAFSILESKASFQDLKNKIKETLKSIKEELIE